MMKQKKEYTPEQIMDTERLCQLTQGIPEEQRKMFTISMIAYLNGMEAGATLKTTGQPQAV